MFKLVIQDDEGKTTIVPLIRDEITIGRKEGNTIRLTERNVSRRHARILRNNGEVHIEDLGSYNGIRVNNARIAERVSLRVSDQVQIGDYKLYLKAEGLDQVDDSRTTPIERVDAPPTETLTVVGPTVPAAQVVPAVPTAPPMIGNPNRTMVAIADTDPGRTVGPVTAAAVAALSAQAGYGRLVVLSSNFAGKEFELSRPQMIIGRTDENDIVINHRSISRNHAKLVREPETGRYTISDLQSSNGVRVNGSDYGKVELRRGDVIDLGHVRLRFVEPGEDFVFARDAVITDVPEAGGKRGMLFAVVAAIVVLVAAVAVYTMRSSADKHTDKATNTGSATTGSGSADDSVADHGTGPGSGVAVAPSVPGSPDGSAGSGGDDTSSPVAANPPARPEDIKVKPSDNKIDSKLKAGTCAELEVNKKWQELIDCAAELGSLGAKDQAKEFHDKATREVANSLAEGKARSALKDGNLKEAQRLLKTIGPDSVYWAALNDQFKAIESPAVDEARRRAQGMASAHECAALKRYQAQLTASSSPNVAAAAIVKCTDKAVAVGPDPGAGARPSGGSGSDGGSGNPGQSPAKANPCEAMNVDDLMLQAQNQFGAGFAKSALSLVTKALTCKQDVRMYRMAVTYACVAHDAASAKLYYSKVSPQFQPPLVQRCQQENIAIP